jgi:hypothetical protein
MSDILIENKKFYNFELYFLYFISFINKLTFILFFVGIFAKKLDYIVQLNFVVKIILASFLIYRFNKYRKDKIKFTELDRKVCYSTGTYIITISFIDFINNYIDTIRSDFILPITEPIIEWVKTEWAKTILKNLNL